MDSRKKKLTQYVVPTILGNCAYFLFTIIDGIFVGQGVGTDALGAVNLVWPFVMVLNAIIMLTVVGGVTVSAVRIGRGDIAGANQAFMHSLAGTLTAAIIMTLIGTCLTSQIATLLGANETYHRLVCDYLFWYSLFAVPSGLMTFMNNYCRNDGSPVLVSVGSTIATVINIFLDWLFVFPLQKGLMGSRKKKLTQYVVPTILGNCAYFLFTIIDGIFVGQGVGTDALGAVNLVWPFVMVLNAIIMLTVVGGVTVSAVRIGRGDIAGANQAFMHSLAGTLTAAIIMTLIGTCLTSQIATLLGANETYHRLVCDYLFWYSLFAVPSGLMTFMNNYCRNDGSPVLVSVGSTIATVINIFLDWLFVFPLQKGLMGAAIATGISQTCGMLIVSTHFILRRGQLRVGRFCFSGKLARKLLLRGTPEAIAQFAVPVATLCTNYVLLGRLGDMAVNAYSIICYVASFSAAIFIGVSSGLQPLLGQSYGAKDAQELRWYFRAGVLIDLIGSTLINVVLLFVGGPICKMFGADALTLACTVQYMPRYAWGFIIMSVNTLISAYLYSTKRTKQAVILNLCRSFLLDSAVIFAVPAIFGGNAVWLTMGIYEGLALLLGVVLLRTSERNGIVFR